MESSPSREAVLHQRNAPFKSEFSVNLFLALVCNLMVYPFSDLFSLDLLPEEIFGTEEIPEYILSDSSTEEEDAMPEQKINH
jgi:hypothetical protein